jgi:hypothetical protein
MHRSMKAPEETDACVPAGGLPTTAFEEHMLADDRPSHPMVIASQFHFAGMAPRDALAGAFENVMRREPLLTARVEGSRLRRPRWVRAPLPRLHHATSAEASSIGMVSFPRLSPGDGPVVHAELVECPGAWTINLAVHHAACDGLGLVAFMERWLLEAAGLQARRARPSHEVLACLQARGRVATSWDGFLRMLPDLRVGLAGVRQFMSRRVLELGTRNTACVEPDPSVWRPTILVAEIDAATFSRVEAVARAEGVTVNDIFAAAFVAVVTEAAEESGAEASGDSWVRLSVPISLRTKSDHLLPAANRVSMVFLDRQREHCADRRALVRGVHAEMELIRSHALGHIMPMSLELGRLMPGGLRRAANRPAAQATAVLSNLGRCFHRSPLVDASGSLRIGESVLESWWIVPPVRPGTALAVATHETGGRRIVAAHVDPAVLSPAAADSILGRFVAWLRDFRSVPCDEGVCTPEVTAR